MPEIPRDIEITLNLFSDAGIGDGNIILKSYRQEHVVQGSKGKGEEKSTTARGKCLSTSISGSFLVRFLLLAVFIQKTN